MRRSTPWLGAASVAALTVAAASAYCLFGQPPPAPKRGAPEPFQIGKPPIGPQDSLGIESFKVSGPLKAVCAYFTNHRLDVEKGFEDFRSNFGTFIFWEDGAASAHVYRNGVAYNQKLLKCEDPAPSDHHYLVLREEPQEDGSGEGWALALDAAAPEEYRIWHLEWTNKSDPPKKEFFQTATRTTTVKERPPSEK